MFSISEIPDFNGPLCAGSEEMPIFIGNQGNGVDGTSPSVKRLTSFGLLGVELLDSDCAVIRPGGDMLRIGREHEIVD